MRLNCSNDDFIRTTEERHHRSSQAIWERMAENGDIYLSKYSGWYSVRDEAYYDEDETRSMRRAQRLGPQGTPVEWVEEESYFFKLSAYQDKLLDLYARVPDFVLPKERINEVASFVRRGLQDLSISRTTFDWGIPVPASAGRQCRSTSCTCGSTRSPTTSPASASRIPIARSSVATGRPTCT